MCLFTLLAMIGVATIAFLIISAGVLGGSIVIVFADVVVCVGIIWLIFKFLVNRNK